MNLNILQIREITKGAVRIIEESDGIHFYRFTKEQEELYKQKDLSAYRRGLATAGVRLNFITDSQKLYIKIKVEKCTTRHYFCMDIFANEQMVGSLNNFTGVELPEKYTEAKLPQGVFSGCFQLGEGLKTVCVYFPWSMIAVLEEIALDEGAFIEPIKTNKKMLIFGDSITQGYDAMHPSNSYASKLADAFGMEAINKGIGAERFFPQLAACKDTFEPEYITVAYGTNDWNRISSDEFQENCKGFFTALRNSYPNTKIYAFTPIWRKDMHNEKKFGEFASVEQYIRQCVETIDNVSVIRGFDFVPKDENYYADKFLHPNDRGCEQHFTNLWKAIQEIEIV